MIMRNYPEEKPDEKELSCPGEMPDGR